MTDERNIKILIIGAGDAGRLVCESIQRDKESSFEVVGFLDDDTAKKDKKICGLNVLGIIDDINKIVNKHNVRELIIAVPSSRGVTVRRIIEN